MCPNAPMPPDDVLAARRKTRYIVDPRKLHKREVARIRQWGLELMNKNEERFKSNKYKDNQVILINYITPEEIDVPALYAFKKLNYVIYKEKQYWSLMLRSDQKVIINFRYAQV